VDLLDAKSRDIKSDITQLATLSVKDSSGEEVKVQAPLHTTTDSNQLVLAPYQKNFSSTYDSSFLKLRVNA